MKTLISLMAILLLSANQALADSKSVQRGRYLTIISGCNDCHTAGFAASGGKINESEWLKGDRTGWHGPWGTTYPINLRTLVSSITPEAWLALTRNSKARPPMPTYVFSIMPDEDLRAIYDFIKSLGPSGEPMPAALPPGQVPPAPYFQFVAGEVPPQP